MSAWLKLRIGKERPDILDDIDGKGMEVTAMSQLWQYDGEISAVDVVWQLYGVASSRQITFDNAGEDIGEIGSSDVQWLVQYISSRKRRDGYLHFQS